MQAPDTNADFWFILANVIGGLFLILAGFILTKAYAYLQRLMGTLAVLTEKIGGMDLRHTEERLKLELRLEKEIAEVRAQVHNGGRAA